MEDVLRGREEVKPEASQAGADAGYVLGDPQERPVLRPIRQPIYDRVKITGTSVHEVAFVNCRSFRDGSPKFISDTNMTYDGILGYPLEYDLSFISIRPSGRTVQYKAMWDAFVSDPWAVNFTLGRNVHLWRGNVQMMEESFMFMNDDWKNIPKEELQDAMTTLAREVPLPRIANVTDAGGRVRRIESTDLFMMEFRHTGGGWTYPDFDFFAVMHGILYANL